MVHLSDEHLRGMRQVGEIRGQILLGVVLAVDRPDEPPVPAGTEVHVGQSGKRAVPRVGEHGVVAGERAVA